ncbi:hypothetical protein BYT27DRAFT_7218474 [Phlegmacium glaucopus]|nr:hypothetical protein BYT27DRAFT_7218474 [Phlegmacium glaucopus]
MFHNQWCAFKVDFILILQLMVYSEFATEPAQQVKGRGSPLWIPELNLNLPIRYQRTGVTIGDVGIIAVSTSFSTYAYPMTILLIKMKDPTMTEGPPSKGAVLTMPHGASSDDLRNIVGFRRYLSDHIENWYRVVNGDRGCEIKNGNLRLVIGCDKAIDWGMATFAKSTIRGESVLLKFRPSGNDNQCHFVRTQYEPSGRHLG